eukprot:TRINITY_DN15540_c0_g1_i1.p1 TRINITY_DN15540_c0_g1~~TRINITY_DN15540_c0_g1_i1.p1  ORF type:complete len:517 (+),score=96.96 TRINITY_DN15540_c0_g1_i1:49-1599(+)
MTFRTLRIFETNSQPFLPEFKINPEVLRDISQHGTASEHSSLSPESNNQNPISLSSSSSTTPQLSSCSDKHEILGTLRRRLNFRGKKETIATSNLTKSTNKVQSRKTLFGVDIIDYVLQKSAQIPIPVQKCMSHIEDQGLVQGIYRIPGNQSLTLRLKQTLDNEEELIDLRAACWNEHVGDIHSVADLVKAYFNELPNPLLTYELYHEFVQVAELPECDQFSSLSSLLCKLPLVHYVTLKSLCHHLNTLLSHKGVTNMGLANLAMAFAPTLLKCREQDLIVNPRELCLQMQRQQLIIQVLIGSPHQLFMDSARDDKGTFPPAPLLPAPSTVVSSEEPTLKKEKFEKIDSAISSWLSSNEEVIEEAPQKSRSRIATLVPRREKDKYTQLTKGILTPTPPHKKGKSLSTLSTTISSISLTTSSLNANNYSPPLSPSSSSSSASTSISSSSSSPPDFESRGRSNTSRSISAPRRKLTSLSPPPSTRGASILHVPNVKTKNLLKVSETRPLTVRENLRLS